MFLYVNPENVVHHSTSSIRDGDGVTAYLSIDTGEIVIADDDFINDDVDKKYVFIGTVDGDDDYDDEVRYFEHDRCEDDDYDPVIDD